MQVILKCNALLIIGLTVAHGCNAGPPPGNQEEKMDQPFTLSGSRIGPPKMKPVIFDGKRYEQVENGEFVGMKQRTGLMAIFDEASNTRLAIVSIYDEKREGPFAAALQDIFFIRFELDQIKRELHIENERHQRFVYQIDDGLVKIVP